MATGASVGALKWPGGVAAGPPKPVGGATVAAAPFGAVGATPVGGAAKLAIGPAAGQSDR